VTTSMTVLFFAGVALFVYGEFFESGVPTIVGLSICTAILGKDVGLAWVCLLCGHRYRCLENRRGLVSSFAAHSCIDSAGFPRGRRDHETGDWG
jgi:hypothetical protein